MNTLIPPSAYHSPDVFAAEQKKLFQRTWACMGFRRDLQKHNDFIARDIGGLSVVVHNFNGELKAFHNVCSHRFNRIHTAPKGNRPLQCAYHGWIYDSSGLPSAIPKRPRFDDLTPERICGLQLASWNVACCGELVFVRRGTDGPTLEEYLGPAFATTAAMSAACGPVIDENVMTIRANWKILVENTLESYHVGFIHPSTFSRLGAGEGTFAWQGPHSLWEAPLSAKFTGRMERIMGLFASRPLVIPGYRHQLIFPGITVASTQGTSFSVQFFEPTSPVETRFTSVVFQTRLGEVSAGTEAAVGALNQSVRDFNRAVFNEDKEVCEQVQRGTTETTALGILSDEELRVSKFQSEYMRIMEASQ